jgi:hypothetical protein
MRQARKCTAVTQLLSSHTSIQSWFVQRVYLYERRTERSCLRLALSLKFFSGFRQHLVLWSALNVACVWLQFYLNHILAFSQLIQHVGVTELRKKV